MSTKDTATNNGNTQPSFEEWLETDLGKDVFFRVTHNRHRARVRMANWETWDDIHQTAFLYMMKVYEKEWFQLFIHMEDQDKAAAIITKLCVQRARTQYSRRVDREQSLPDEDEDAQQEHFETWQRETTDLRRTERIDRRIDIELAKRKTAADLLTQYKKGKPRTDMTYLVEQITFVHEHLKTNKTGRYGEKQEYLKQQGICLQVRRRWEQPALDSIKFYLAAYKERN